MALFVFLTLSKLTDFSCFWYTWNPEKTLHQHAAHIAYLTCKLYSHFTLENPKTVWTI